MNTYEVTVTRDGKWWMLAIPALDGVTQARRVGEIELMAKEYIAVTLDVPIDDVNVAVRFESFAHVDFEIVEELRAERAEAEQLSRIVAVKTEAIAEELRAAKVPVRDIGDLLGISFQRAQQITAH